MTTTVRTSELDTLEQLSLVLRSSDTTAAKEEDQTLALYKNSIDTMQRQIRELAAKNRTLCTELVTVESQKRELVVVHASEIFALQGKVKTSEDAVEAMRKEMLETMQKANQMVQAARAEKEAAVKAATELADARVAAAKQEVETQMKVQRAELLRQVRSAADGQVNKIRSFIEANTRHKDQNRGSQPTFLMCYYKECAFGECYREVKEFADRLEKLT